MFSINNLKQTRSEYTKAGALGLPMRLRLFLFLIVLVVTMILGVVVILLTTGTFKAGLNESEKLLKKELNHSFQSVSEQYTQLSLQTIAFSKVLSANLEKKLHRQGIGVLELPNHPEILENLLAGEYELALLSLQKAKSSGVFIILNATVNATLENAETSKAGLFIKNMEPNILSSSSPTILVLRGFPSIARKNLLPLHPQWSMEFDITAAPYYELPLKQAASCYCQ